MVNSVLLLLCLLYTSIRSSENFFLASDGAYSGAVEQIIEEQIEKSCQADIREGLQISELQKKMHTKKDVLEYEYNIGKQGAYNLSLIHISFTS